jgi:hypothetical protein
MKNLRTEIKWSIVFSLVVLLWMALEKLSGLHGKYIDYQLYLTNLFLIPAIILFVLALKEKRKYSFAGEMSYKQGFITGAVMTIFIALLSPLTQWITSFVITPEYFPNVIKRSVELGYFSSTAEAEANFNYKNYAVQGAIGHFILGLIFTVIIMLFLRSKKES